ncbi:hypothetical protein DFH07DRAFT_1062067 [Mycena maculata]|uniref:Uncharacterized protein n=1 Tax=Mycena maculata TaxID=230809 RepID=A0AAD7IXM9_9AGAR|nr:hypothetical protein DFH07DRAFT_1062067 [Mycena maculata]
MVAQPSLPLVGLVGLILGTLFYGMYFIIFVISMYLLFESARGSGKYRSLFASVVFMSGWVLFIAITGNWVATLVRITTGFIYFENGLGASKYFNDDSQANETIASAFLSLSVFIGDAMIIYRLWVVWAYNKTVTIIPILSLLGFFTSCIITLQATVHITDALKSIALDVGLTPISVFTLVPHRMGNLENQQQSICGQVDVPISPLKYLTFNSKHFLAILVESAALYTSWAIYYTICHQLNSNLQFIALNAFPSIAGIANALIHVRIGLGRTIEQIYGSGAKSSSSVVTAPMRFAPQPAGSGSGGTGTVAVISRV